MRPLGCRVAAFLTVLLAALLVLGATGAPLGQAELAVLVLVSAFVGGYLARRVPSCREDGRRGP